MDIAVAVQEGTEVCLYDADNNKLFSKEGELYCYTKTMVAIKKYDPIGGNWLQIYGNNEYEMCITILKYMPNEGAWKPTPEQVIEEFQHACPVKMRQEHIERMLFDAACNEASALGNARRKAERRMAVEIAKKLLADGMSVEKVAKITKLTVDDILRL